LERELASVARGDEPQALRADRAADVLDIIGALPRIVRLDHDAFLPERCGAWLDLLEDRLPHRGFRLEHRELRRRRRTGQGGLAESRPALVGHDHVAEGAELLEETRVRGAPRDRAPRDARSAG